MLKRTLIYRQYHICLPVIAVIAVCAFAPARESRGGLIWEAGHGDIGVAYEGGALELHYHMDAGAVFENGHVVPADPPGGEEYGPSEMYVRVRDPYVFRSAGSPTFLGPGNQLWFLPQTSAANKPFVGIASEELNPDDWTGGISWALTDFSGPVDGNFSLWQADPFNPFAPPVVHWSTYDTGGSDTFTAVVGGHDHHWFGFTAEGVYTLEITASGIHNVAGLISDTASYTFLVGDATAVPEPSTIVLFGIAAAGAVPWWLRKRRRNQAKIVDPSPV